jgi:hypothetical protein
MNSNATQIPRTTMLPVIERSFAQSKDLSPMAFPTRMTVRVTESVMRAVTGGHAHRETDDERDADDGADEERPPARKSAGG